MTSGEMAGGVSLRIDANDGIVYFAVTLSCAFWCSFCML